MYRLISLLAIFVIAAPCMAQTTISTRQQSILWPAVPTTFSSGGFSFTIPPKVFTIIVPSQSLTVPVATNGTATSTNWVSLTNQYNVTNWTFLTVTQTNVQPVWITNTLPNYIDALTVIGPTKLGDLYVSTNSTK